ncbi:MAG TPA: penicillin-binding protein 2, partial [Ktedonobacterales bacterium]|nr:penicillin-binding protein 2 [Ktedonobacterales bacterium]
TIQAASLIARANAEHLRAVRFAAERGMILDANGNILAVSVTRDLVIADPDVIRQSGALDTDAQTLGQALGLPPGLARSQLDIPGAYVTLTDPTGTPLLLNDQQRAAVNAALAHGALVGVALYPQVIREYPDGGLAAQVLGFVRASDGIGQYGVELAKDALLAGQPGLLYTAVDANGNPLATGPQRLTPAIAGANITLTLDANIQYWAEQGLAQTIAATQADGGTVIALDPRTGAILAMASEPSFNPNAYGQASLADLTNPAVSAIYDPGSVMKAVTMAAGIQTGVITPQSSLDDPGYTVVDGIPIYNFDRQGHGWENMTQVLQYSSNVGAIWVGQRVGQARFDSTLAAFGFGAPTGVDLPDESAGLLAQPTTPGAGALTLAENSFGESIGVTPLQMAMAYAALANGGVLMRPYVVASATLNGGLGRTITYGPQAIRRVVSAATAQTVTQMLVTSALVSEAQMNLVSGYSVAAKTGTSTPDPSHPDVTYASVLGYAPASDPRVVLLVKLDHPRTQIYGGAAAGPLWRTLIAQILRYYRVPPDLG